MSAWRSIVRHPIFGFFASLKLAVFTLLTLSGVLAVATILESIYGTRAVKVLVYGTPWFYGILLLLAINVLCAALSRYPWKRHQTGFVVTHSGILIVLAGSYLTMAFGVDGSLPVVQGQQNQGVILPGLRLEVQPADSKRRASYPFPDSAFAQKGSLFKVDLGGGHSIEVDRYYPRATFKEVFEPSPLDGVGAPALEVELYNTRFRVREWLVANHPATGAVKDLGPAQLKFVQLWDKEAEKRFFEPPPAKPKAKPIGFLVGKYRDGTYRLPIEGNIGRWRPLPGSGLQVFVERYLAHAIVRDNKLASKSDQPVNPAVQIQVRNAAGEVGRYSVFARFPEFSTHHGTKSRAGERKSPIGIEWQFVSTPNASQGQGRLEFAQTADRSKVLFRVFNRAGDMTNKGEVSLDEALATGWMDLRFRVKRWEPVSVKRLSPTYVDQVPPGSQNFLSSVRVRPVSQRQPAKQTDGVWIMEGGRRVLKVGGKKFYVSLARTTQELPFAIQLDKFTVGTDPGTTKAATYESDVRVQDPKGDPQPQVKIAMNEPLYYGGYTFYQASYQLRPGQPPISIFSVNFDPGRWMKYLGSIILCLGICIMFYMNPHYWDKVFGQKGSS